MPKNIELKKEVTISFLKNKIKNRGNLLKPRRKVPLLIIYHLLHLGRILASLWAKSNGLSHTRAICARTHTHIKIEIHICKHIASMCFLCHIYLFSSHQSFCRKLLAASTTIYLQLLK